MSASLVGSEMCIRDRWTTAPKAAASGFEKLRAFLSLGRSRQRVASLLRMGAVSYTHLTLPTIC
eukprot:6804638-Alexandrium_andersonii.AAC.1